MDYQKKYLKYKHKYLNMSGGNLNNILEAIKNLTNGEQAQLIAGLTGILGIGAISGFLAGNSGTKKEALLKKDLEKAQHALVEQAKALKQELAQAVAQLYAHAVAQLYAHANIAQAQAMAHAAKTQQENEEAQRALELAQHALKQQVEKNRLAKYPKNTNLHKVDIKEELDKINTIIQLYTEENMKLNKFITEIIELLENN